VCGRWEQVEHHGGKAPRNGRAGMRVEQRPQDGHIGGDSDKAKVYMTMTVLCRRDRTTRKHILHYHRHRLSDVEGGS
jgi:hypothetical protein